jgi:hypothetical protein
MKRPRSHDIHRLTPTMQKKRVAGGPAKKAANAAQKVWDRLVKPLPPR